MIYIKASTTYARFIRGAEIGTTPLESMSVHIKRKEEPDKIFTVSATHIRSHHSKRQTCLIQRLQPGPQRCVVGCRYSNPLKRIMAHLCLLTPTSTRYSQRGIHQ